MGIEASRRRLRGYLAMIPEGKRDLWEPMVEDLAFMEDRLSVTRDELKDARLSTSGGKMPHKNPAFDAYCALFDRYLRGLQALAAAIQAAQPAAASGEESAAKVVPKRGLESFRRRGK